MNWFILQTVKTVAVQTHALSRLLVYLCDAFPQTDRNAVVSGSARSEFIVQADLRSVCECVSSPLGSDGRSNGTTACLPSVQVRRSACLHPTCNVWARVYFYFIFTCALCSQKQYHRFTNLIRSTTSSSTYSIVIFA